jgi:4-amino-4-deoxy-L-arabinose transferase-like glycosyltransferase
MQEQRQNDSPHNSFSRFLREHWPLILLILLLAFGVRLAFVLTSPPAKDDALYRYIIAATNMLDGHGFSRDWAPPYRPGESSVPLYPLFVAATYAVFGRHELAVKLLQAFMDLGTCLLVAFVSFTLAPIRLKKSAAILSLTIYAAFWYGFLWTAWVLTETLAIFLTMLVVTLCTLAMRKGGWFWVWAGAACGLAILTRPDSVLLLGAVLLFLGARAVRNWSWEKVSSILFLCLAVALTLTPWIVRNYLSLGKFQPLASEYGFAQSAYMPTGYLLWVRTWLTVEKEMECLTPAFFPHTARYFDPGIVPDRAFDSAAERQRVLDLIAQYNRTRLFSPEIDDEFRAIANDRIRRAPARFFLILPLRRAAFMWVQSFGASSWARLFLRLLAVLSIIVGGILGFSLFCRRSQLAALLMLVILVRTLYLGFHYAPETRYIIEAYPPLIAACGVTAAAVLLYVRQFRAQS